MKGMMFPFDDFRNWMDSQDDQDYKKPARKYDEYVGCEVYLRVNLKKLVEGMESDVHSDTSLNRMAKEFKQNGGLVTDFDGSNFTIQVKSGNFICPRYYVKKD